jgi:hypothetical protein
MLEAGARIAVYPNRARLTGLLLAELVAVAVMAGFVAILHGDQYGGQLALHHIIFPEDRP